VEGIYFVCAECGKAVVYPSKNSDGHRCDCGGYLLAKNSCTVRGGNQDKPEPRIFYLCDHRACNSCHGDDEKGCQHTSDIRHAKNFELSGNIFWEK
jgi:DNA-directed RNA polymerase subunit RPC12/RpoP